MEAPASAGTLRVARESAEAPRRIAAGRAEWMRLTVLAEFRDEWRDLAGRALEPNVFYDPAFALAAAPVFGADAGAVLVWSKATPTRLIGLFPARTTRRYGVMTALTGWTHSYAPFGVPLVDREEADAAITAFLDYIEADPKFPRLVLLPLIDRDGPFAALLTRVLLRHGGALAHFGEHARALLAPTAGRLRYLDHAVGGKKHKELRRQRRRLLEKGLLKVASTSTVDDIPRALSDYLALEAASWKGRAGSAARQNADICAFMQTAIESLAADGGARIDRLMQNGHPLAATITLRSGDCAWFWKIAYDEDFAKFSPGVQVSLDLTELLLAEPDIARVDSCATADHPMIDHLWRERLALADLLIAPSAAAQGQFAIALHLETLRRAFITAAKNVRDGLKR
jgi:CelD/BcsL family acetyltransferase involved in cellulose biosynthesis